MNEFYEGQKVNFCHISRSGKNINYSTRMGKILLVKENTLSVVYRKKLFVVNKKNATPLGEKTALTKAFNNLDK